MNREYSRYKYTVSAIRSGLSCRKRARIQKRRSQARAFESLETRQLLVADLLISEFMASPTNQPGNLADKDGDFSDWIEIHNSTAAPINLAGWTLTDKSNDLDQWEFPNHTLGANGYLVVFASEKDVRTPGQELHTNFKLGGGGEYLALVAPDGVTFGSEFQPINQINNISYGPNSAYTSNGYFTTPSPGQPNTTEPIADPTRRIVINEIMYHPQTENDQHEFIELVNRGTQTVNLTGWQFTAGVDYTFGNVSLAPNQFLVIAANVPAFNARYPGVANVVGGWTGSLSNTGENVRLRDNVETTVDEVAYADQGDWGTRIEVSINGNSWDWEALSDGGGRSLELRNWQLTNDSGQNWGSSTAASGSTPGLQNSINSTNLAPLIANVDQSVAIPSTTTAVTITADITDESATGLTVNLRWRTGTGTFNTLQMFDDGAHGDGIAGDGEYGATIPAQTTDGTIVEYYVEARDGSNQTRTWPAPGRRTTGTTEQVVNALYRVDNALAAAASNAWTPGSEPIFVFVMTAAEYTRFNNLSNDSDAQGFGTFVSIDGTGTSVRHSAGVRIRGASSRSYDPPPVRMELPHDNPWHGYSDFNLNSRFPELQLLGSAVLREAGLQAASGTRIQLRINGVNGAFGGQSPRLGSYIWVEPFNSEFLDKHNPLDSSGNIYKKVRPPVGWAWRNGNIGQYIADGWSKSTNASENDWSDLDNLMRVMNQTPAGPGYYPAVSAVANVDQWVRWFAAMELLNSRETNLSNGADDDYQLYRGMVDSRFILLPHDMDTILGQGDTGSSPTDPFFEAIDPDGESMPILINFFNDPTIRTKYYLSIKDLSETTFSPQRMAEIIDDVLLGYVDQGRINAMKSYAASRAAYAISILPAGLTPPAPPTPPVDPVVPVTSSLIINEVLANNVSVAHSATFPDMIELHNIGATAINLAGMSITDSVNSKAKYVFPAGTTINPGQYLVLYGDSAQVAGEHHIGFALDRTGDGVYLYNTVASGQALMDSVEFGHQIPNLSIGRLGQDRQWALTQPTFGAVNVAQATGSADTLEINEWFADGDIRFQEDYVELFNPAALPVSLAGLYLTDEAVGAPQQHRIPALSYIAANGFAEFIADDQTGGNHLPFQLSADFDHLGLFARNGVLLDQVLYRPQTTDISQGFHPDGSSTKVFDTLPTPGVSNPIPASPTQTLFGWNSSWRFNEAGDQGTAWRGPAFNDAAAPSWENGTGIIARVQNRGAIPANAPFPTDAPGNNTGTDLNDVGRSTYYFRKQFTIPANATRVQFRHLIDDGAIIYVNGVELVNAAGQTQRFNMTSGAYNFSTLATTSITTASYSALIDIPLSMLNLGGSNLIAVEVHQGPNGSTDLVFGMDIQASVSVQQSNVPVRAPGLFAGLRVTEVMYNPLGGNQYEYIELQNTGASSLDMTGVRLSGAVEFTFPAMTLAAGARTVVAANVAAFRSRYGSAANVAGFYAGDLGNGGEDIVLQLPDPYDAGILRFDYNDTWYPNTDGAGYALVVNNTSTAANRWDQRTTWRSSANVLGSPGVVDPVPASVNGQIFNDTNGNGIQNAGEVGRANVPVSLYFAGADGIFGGTGDVLIGTVNTSATGDYSFTGLLPGAYYLSAVPPAGLGFSALDQGGNDATDSDFDPLTRRTEVFTLSVGQNDTSRDGLLSSAAPSVDIIDVTPDPRITSVSSINIVFDQAVTGFNLADLSLTRGGGANLLTAAQTLSTSDNITWTLGNLAGLTDPAGTYLLTLTAAGSGIAGSASGLPIIAGATDSFTVLSASVNGRHIFYNESFFDGNNAAANAQDDAAIAPDKTALLPGGTATFANYTSYNSGINGVMIDVAGLAGTPTAGDFTFRTGNDNTPSAWAVWPTAPSITVRPGAGVGGSDRITLIWPSFTLTKRWLQVTVNPSTNTGIRAPDVFYFGNAIGEIGDTPLNARVTAVDEINARNNPRTVVNPADILDKHDFNRDARVSAVDQIISRNNRTQILDALSLIRVPAALQAGGLSSSEPSEGGSAIALGLPPQSLTVADTIPGLTAQALATQAPGSSTGSTKAEFVQLASSSETLPRRSDRAADVSDELLDLLVAGSK